MATKYTKWQPNRLNVYKIHIPTFSLQGPPKFTQIGIFWFENMPSGSPARPSFP
jgi:hypothetical protein